MEGPSKSCEYGPMGQRPTSYPTRFATSAAAAGADGSRTTNRVPPSGGSSATISPPCSSRTLIQASSGVGCAIVTSMGAEAALNFRAFSRG